MSSGESKSANGSLPSAPGNEIVTASPEAIAAVVAASKAAVAFSVKKWGVSSLSEVFPTQAPLFTPRRLPHDITPVPIGDAIEIYDTKTAQGRIIRARRDFKRGELILVDRPIMLTHLWGPNVQGTTSPHSYPLTRWRCHSSSSDFV
jgi:hypothetical protein